MKALILAAGYATRLYPLTKEFPKPLLEVENKPIIDYIIDKLDSLGEVTEIIVVTNSKFFPRFETWRTKQKTKIPINIMDDLTKDNATRRGAIGDMDFAIRKKKLNDDLLVIGGDNLFDSALEGFVSFCKAKSVGSSPVIGVYDIKHKSSANKYGVVKLDKQSRIIDFQEKPNKPKSSLVAMCLYYFPKKTLSLLKEYLKARTEKRDATGLYIDWLKQKTAVYGFILKGRWYDIGDHEFYRKAKERFAK